MIPLFTREAVRALDAAAIAAGTPGRELMERAGRGAAEIIVERFGDALADVVVVGALGHNGGDGWVVARALAERGLRPTAVLVGDPLRLTGDPRATWEALRETGVVTEVLDERAREPFGALDAALDDATLVVDALFGTGLARPIEGRFADVVARLNACRAPVVALDVPSGVDADTGGMLGCAVEAALTVTFGAQKQGLHQHPGARLAGEVRCVPIGLDVPATSAVALVEPRDVEAWLPRRRLDAHKGDAGHVLVLAGAPGRTGAALLAGLGALRAGAGLATLVPRAGGRVALDAKVVELMTDDLPTDLEAACAAAHRLAADKKAAVIGPGLGLDATGLALSARLARELAIPAVLDADALTALGTELASLCAAAAPRVLTPHPGEAGRLLGASAADVQADRYAAARRLAKESGAVVALKGAGTIVADPSGALRVCDRGTPAMASAGMGDVLGGVIAALLAGGAPAFDAASAGVHLHAVAGEHAARADRGLLASELAAAIPDAIREVAGDVG